jgi:glucokinase
VGAFQHLIELAGQVDGIGIAMPGPFDMRTGKGAMTEKFGALNGLYLPELLSRKDIRFIQDATAFLIGEILRGKAGTLRRVGAITLGTGLGSVAAIDGKPLLNEELRPVAEHALWKRPFKGGTVEDHISTRGILARYPEAGSVKEIGSLAEAGDTRALEVWRTTGKDLAEVLSGWIDELSLEYVVVGGQIAKSFHLFAEPLQGLPVETGDLSGDSPLYAAASLFTKNENRSVCNE